MKSVSIINQKGGVGKTTTASALSAGLLRKGKRCLVVDSDPQGNLSASIGLDPEGEIHLMTSCHQERDGGMS